MNHLSFSKHAIELANDTKFLEDSSEILPQLLHGTVLRELEEISSLAGQLDYLKEAVEFFEILYSKHGEGDVSPEAAKHLEYDNFRRVLAKFYRTYADALLLNGDFKEVSSYCEKVLELYPEDFAVGAYTEQVYAAALIAIGQFEKAAELIDSLEDKDVIFYSYNTALLEIAKGEEVTFLMEMEAAFRRNRWLLRYLSGERELPKNLSIKNPIKKGSAAGRQWYFISCAPAWFAIDDIENALSAALRLFGSSKKKSSSRKQAKALLARSTVIDFERQILASDLSNHKNVLRLLCAWGEEIFSRRPWEIFGECPVYCFKEMPQEDSGEIEPLLVSHCSGVGGQIFGCNVYFPVGEYDFMLGDLAAASMSDASPASVVRASMVHWASCAHTFSYEHISYIERREQKLLTDCGVSRRSDEMLYPSTKLRGQMPRISQRRGAIQILLGLLSIADVMTGEHSVEGLSLVDGLSYFLKPELAEFFLSTGAFEARATTTGLKLVGGRPSSYLNNLQKTISKHPVREAAWYVGLLSGIGAIENKITKTADMACLSLVVDSESGCILASELSSGDVESSKMIARGIKKAITSCGFAPQKLLVNEGVYGKQIAEDLSQLERVDVSVAEEAELWIEAAYAMIEAQNKHLSQIH